ncbi:UNVERIFIED_CONTAM: hypothetical protein NCL1_52420 [Trichonephila clavipes]
MLSMRFQVSQYFFSRKKKHNRYFSGGLTSSEANFREMTTDGIRECLSQDVCTIRIGIVIHKHKLCTYFTTKQMYMLFQNGIPIDFAYHGSSLNMQMCGVISERTGRFCRNTLNCSMHDVGQRREVRDLFLGSAVEPPLADDVQIDVDTVDEDSIVPLWYTNQRAPRRNSSHAETDAGPNSSRRIGELNFLSIFQLITFQCFWVHICDLLRSVFNMPYLDKATSCCSLLHLPNLKTWKPCYI